MGYSLEFQRGMVVPFKSMMQGIVDTTPQYIPISQARVLITGVARVGHYVIPVAECMPFVHVSGMIRADGDPALGERVTVGPKTAMVGGVEVEVPDAIKGSGGPGYVGLGTPSRAEKTFQPWINVINSWQRHAPTGHLVDLVCKHDPLRMTDQCLALRHDVFPDSVKVGEATWWLKSPQTGRIVDVDKRIPAITISGWPTPLLCPSGFELSRRLGDTVAQGESLWYPSHKYSMKENMRAALAGAVRAQLAKDLIPEMSDYGAEVNCEVPVVKGRKVCHPDAMMCLACQKDVAQETCPHCGAAAVRHVSAVVRTGERVSTKCFPQAPTYGLRTRLEYMITLIRQQRFGKLLDEATRGGKWVRELAK